MNLQTDEHGETTSASGQHTAVEAMDKEGEVVLLDDDRRLLPTEDAEERKRKVVIEKLFRIARRRMEKRATE